MSDIKTVIREVTDGVWTFSRPFTRLNFWHIGGRSTAIKLSSGGVWILASTTLDEPTRKVIDKLGPVQYIVGADAGHYLFLGEYQKAYPEAKLLTVEVVAKKAKDLNYRVDGFWSDANPVQEFGFEEDIKSCYFSGFENKDVAFLHKSSRTLIQADLLFNSPCTEQYSMYGWPWNRGKQFFGLFGGVHAWSGLAQFLVNQLGKGDPEAMTRDARTVAGWDFGRVIPCHGDVIETRGNDAWRTAYKHWLQPKQV
ncbi:hypothetical protein PENSPDRAFT_679849 [Peniophora sp. CONT]|nr:hypothetical protein PENSPDRAFT_679849 [Peniophora sp. CONT]